VPSDQPSTMVDEPPTSPRRGRRRRNKGPKPWFVLKLSVAVAAAIIAYGGYVYIGRLCIPMIKRERDSLGSRRLGSEYLCLPPPLPILFHCDFFYSDDFLIYVLVFLGLSVIFLVVFVVLGMMMIWAYIKVRTWLYNHASPSLHPLHPNAQRVCLYENSCLGWVDDWVRSYSPHQVMLSRCVPSLCSSLSFPLPSFFLLSPCICCAS
jgi:hypothetical protein